MLTNILYSMYSVLHGICVLTMFVQRTTWNAPTTQRLLTHIKQLKTESRLSHYDGSNLKRRKGTAETDIEASLVSAKKRTLGKELFTAAVNVSLWVINENQVFMCQQSIPLSPLKGCLNMIVQLCWYINISFVDQIIKK